MRTTPLLLIVFLVTLLLGGCSGRYIVDDPAYLNARGPVAVDVESFGGDVIIIVDPDIRDPKVEVNRESTMGYGRGSEAIESLTLVNWTAELVGGRGGQVLRVRTSTSAAEPYFQCANLEIRLPDVDGVKVHTPRGRVFVTGVRGELDIATGDGDIRVATNDPIRVPVRLTTGGGGIEFRIRGESCGDLDFVAAGGKVTHRIKYGRTIIHPGTDHRALRATFNEGRNPIILRAEGGDIRFVVDDNPMDFGSMMF